MLSLSQLKNNIFPVFKLMKVTGCTFEIIHKGIVYDMSVKQTNKSPKRTRAKKPRLHNKVVDTMEMTTCTDCGSVMVSGICLNTQCPTNSR